MRELFATKRASERTVWNKERKWENCLEQREQVRKLFGTKRESERTVWNKESKWENCLEKREQVRELYETKRNFEKIEWNSERIWENSMKLRVFMSESFQIENLQLSIALHFLFTCTRSIFQPQAFSQPHKDSIRFFANAEKEKHNKFLSLYVLLFLADVSLCY